MINTLQSILKKKVEWDKEAAIPEVQRIVTSLDLNTNEVQTITTSADDINEVQIIATSATPKEEIQTITVSPPPGHSSIDSAWSYAIKLDTSASGGSLQYSGQISATAGESGYRESMSDILGAMLNMDGLPTVSKSTQNPDGGFTYTVIFPASMGDVPEMEVYLSDLPVHISTIENGNILSGSFRLEFNGEITEEIPYDSSSSNVRSKLEDLSSIGSVSVTRQGPNEQNGFSWKIEFTSDLNAGNINNIIPHGMGLSTSNDIGGASIKVIGGGTDGSYIQGTFQLEFGK